MYTIRTSSSIEKRTPNKQTQTSMVVIINSEVENSFCQHEYEMLLINNLNTRIPFHLTNFVLSMSYVIRLYSNSHNSNKIITWILLLLLSEIHLESTACISKTVFHFKWFHLLALIISMKTLSRIFFYLSYFLEIRPSDFHLGC